MSVTLLLNASYEPLRVISWRRAVVLVLDGKADVVEAGDVAFRAATLHMTAPLVVRLRYMVAVPFRGRLPLTRERLLARDRHRCAYCGTGGVKLTVDHVHPRSRGGQHVWENVVAACGPCNNAKGAATLAELGWSLDVEPRAPRGRMLIGIGFLEPDPTWAPYITGFSAGTS